MGKNLGRGGRARGGRRSKEQVLRASPEGIKSTVQKYREGFIIKF